MTRLGDMPTDQPRLVVPEDDHAHRAADSFRMLADPTRIKILWSLLQGESNVGALADLVGAAPTTVSQHLAKLRLAGLVTSRRDGTFVYYSAADGHVHRLLAEALSHGEHASGTASGGDPHRYDVSRKGSRPPRSGAEARS